MYFNVLIQFFFHLLTLSIPAHCFGLSNSDMRNNKTNIQYLFDVYVFMLFMCIKVCDEGSLVGCFRFKIICSKQTAKLMKESVLLFMFYAV